MCDEVPLEVREAWDELDRQLFAVANGISGTSIGEAIQACKDFAVANASRNKFDEIYYVDPEKWEKELNHEVRNGQHCFAFNHCSPIDYLANTKAAELGIDANKLAWFPPLRRQLDLLGNVIERIPPFAFLLHRESARDDLLFAIRLYFLDRQTSLASEAIKSIDRAAAGKAPIKQKKRKRGGQPRPEIDPKVDSRWKEVVAQHGGKHDAAAKELGTTVLQLKRALARVRYRQKSKTK